LLYYKDTLETL